MATFSSLVPRTRKTILLLNVSFTFLFFFYIVTSYVLDEHKTIGRHSSKLHESTRNDGCNGLHDYKDYKYKCTYVKSHTGCRSKGYINYLEIFYCTCGKIAVLGHFVLLLWLLVLFYLLGNIATDYFCPSLDKLSKILKLSPTIAGVTLLSLGNGASDVFSCIVSFTRSSEGNVGLNSVLGGAFFVSCVVVGVISTLISSKEISVDKTSFIRDVCFFLLSLCALFLINLAGKITLWSSIAFLSIYFFYVAVVCMMTHFQYKEEKDFCTDIKEDSMETGIPLLGYVDGEPVLVDKTTTVQDLQQQQDSSMFCNIDSSFVYYLGKFWYVLEMPLYLPRRLTIPVTAEERWSKPFAVASVTLAPLLLAALFNTQSGQELSSKSSLITLIIAGLIGMVLGSLAYMTTKKSTPPKKCLFPWLAGGFLMSVTWTYITAAELVSLLVSLGHILGINPSVLGLTVLAWGNSLGDLMANGAMAVRGGADGVQIAVSGCYAGPMFNTLVGLGISFVISSWSKYPSHYLIPQDPSLNETLGFLMAGLLWALVILPRNNMRVDRFFGIGLLAIYSCFLFLRLARAIGLLNFHGVSIFKT